MDDKLKDYLAKCTPATVDSATLDDLRCALERAVPKIAESIRRRELLAAHLRDASSKPSKAESEKQN